MKKEEKRHIVKWVILILLLIIVGYVLWVVIFYPTTCETQDCFNQHLKECKRASFIGGNKMIFEYIVEGKTGDNCMVNVKLLQGELNNQDSLKLEGKEMICEVPLGSIATPESNIKKCHGLLKEGLQDMIITKLHTYIVQNLGRINLELLDIPESAVPHADETQTDSTQNG